MENDKHRIFEVPKEYITIVVGKNHKKIDDFATKSETKIIVPPRRISEGTVCSINQWAINLSIGKSVNQ